MEGGAAGTRLYHSCTRTQRVGKGCPATCQHLQGTLCLRLRPFTSHVPPPAACIDSIPHSFLPGLKGTRLLVLNEVDMLQDLEILLP